MRKYIVAFIIYCVLLQSAYSQQFPKVMDATLTPPNFEKPEIQSIPKYNYLNFSKHKTNLKDLALINTLRRDCDAEFDIVFDDPKLSRSLNKQDSSSIPVIEDYSLNLNNSSLSKILRFRGEYSLYKVYINYSLTSPMGRVITKTFSCTYFMANSKFFNISNSIAQE